MLTYTSARTMLTRLTGEKSSGGLDDLIALYNERVRRVVSAKPWKFRQKTWTRSTETDNVHQLPTDCAKVVDITVTIGSTKHKPKEVKSREEWDRLTQSTDTTSNTPERYFIFGRTYSFYPAPASATSNAITIAGQRMARDISQADYSTGTITTATNGSTSITGSGTSWTAPMAGRYFRITPTDAAGGGDGLWYEISSIDSATTLTLSAPYEGTSISGGSATYTIGDAPIIPEDHQMTPLYGVLVDYFSFIQPEQKRAAEARTEFIDGMARMNVDLGSSTI